MTEFNLYQTTARQRHRALIDKLVAVGVTSGGFGVIAAIILIFVFLFSVAFPVFLPASLNSVAEYSETNLSEGRTLFTGLSENGELAYRINQTGMLQFFYSETGVQVKRIDNVMDAALNAVIPIDIEGNRLGLLDIDNKLIIIEIGFFVDFSGGGRVLVPQLSYPFGDESIPIDSLGDASLLNVGIDEEGVTVVYLDQSEQLHIDYYLAEEGDELSAPETESQLEITQSVDFLMLNESARRVLILNTDGVLKLLDITDKSEPEVMLTQTLAREGVHILTAELLLGGESLITAASDHELIQWTLLRGETSDYEMVNIRQFQSAGDLGLIKSEARRKGLLTLNTQQQVSLFHTTGGSELLTSEPLSDEAILNVALSSRADTLLIEKGEGKFQFFEIDNEHPEVSWHALWEKVWYESYPSPNYIWQSSSADDDFEPKFSLVPLVFGTLKAAFYAMIIAMPLAIMGAIYTAYFMAPKMRTWVKPGIEIMEALPTVILGFLAGLWLAPVIESNLLAFFSLLIVVPLGFMLFAVAWQFMPARLRYLVPAGWEAALLMPVLVILVVFAFQAGPVIESFLFDGNIQRWMRLTLGIDYDQRNSLVVGIAMGLAVIPTIFSITEDAVYSVPRHLTEGSLALGATPWQTLTGVVILTASPGIFSAVMIGLGRAVGETMIVLMATGNTAIMDFSVFEGMRTLSANIAVELPESELDSSHYRILFLAALVLFGATFLFNTAAEVIRQRLRDKYSNL